ncbi:hypothetical protein V5N11_004255 [Cardamine amara subsp. amara]|uniref:Uncharacterized protein n=1 Tax=Cardamine amara subsp. amara TaxID=228776 RepID=A0ABD1BXN2_CARAN
MDKKGIDNGVADHLSRIRIEDGIPIDYSVPQEQLMVVGVWSDCRGSRTSVEHFVALSEGFPWYADMVNYKATGKDLDDLDPYRKKKFFKDSYHYFLDEPFLYKRRVDC